MKRPVFKQSALQLGDVQDDRHEIQNLLAERHERERLRLAQELHDIPIQDLFGLMYQLGELKEFVNGTQGMEIVQEFDHTIHRIVNNLRAICGELRPPSLSPFGLEVAIRDHAEKMHKQFPEIQFHLDLTQDHQELSDSVRLWLFRIYQESVNNVVRHAHATDVYIRFRLNSATINLEVEDNGNGFEIPQHGVDLVRQQRFGLVGLAERVESIQGALEISSALGEGTLVRVVVPRR